jgi:beta-galactosidase
MSAAMRLGVCYYPEHWPEAWWPEDARRMAELGLSRVRIGEFAWSRIEPDPGRFEWGWLDRAIETLAAAGLGIILCTPTATPPKWLVDRMPDMLQVDEFGRPRRFGSRRHYCFSHEGYRREAARITEAVAERYGMHPAVVAWQTDNEYGCHDTVVSYSDAAARGFRVWLRERYGDVFKLNRAWGNVFWSQEYRSFDEVDPPHLTVTEANPAHRLDWQRFASDEVVAFNRLQVDILRRHSPGRKIVHNFMGFFTAFDHHKVARDLDAATWDSYPLGFLEQFWFPAADKQRYARQGHPDIAAFHHDLYRGCGSGRMWVMEQQPGPVNWARSNPAPLPGMVRLWTLEALAHGAGLMSYFRWRQAPFGQEQMHAGLLLPDSRDSSAVDEVRAATEDMQQLTHLSTIAAPVALVFSYEAAWLLDIQPQGGSFQYLQLAFAMYSALRRLGLDVDIVSPDASLERYALVVCPSLPISDPELTPRLAKLDCPVLLGPRSGSKTRDFSIPPQLPPGDLQGLVPLKVVRVESLRAGLKETGDGFTVERWLEHVETELVPDISLGDGRGLVFRNGRVRYCAAWPDEALLLRLFKQMAEEARVPTSLLPEEVRTRRHGDLRFAFNYGSHPVTLRDSAISTDAFVLGGPDLPPAGVAAWREGPVRPEAGAGAGG